MPLWLLIMNGMYLRNCWRDHFLIWRDLNVWLHTLIFCLSSKSESSESNLSALQHRNYLYTSHYWSRNFNLANLQAGTCFLSSCTDTSIPQWIHFSLLWEYNTPNNKLISALLPLMHTYLKWRDQPLIQIKLQIILDRLNKHPSSCHHTLLGDCERATDMTSNCFVLGMHRRRSNPPQPSIALEMLNQ